jgi:O-antigen biosynthesis protein
VLLVSSPAPPPGLSPFYTGEKLMPLGLGYLIAALERAGHDVEFQDLFLRDAPLPLPDRFDAVAISANTVCFRGTRRVINECVAARRRGWKGKIIVGGPHTSVAAETVPAEVDHLVQGEGELALLGVLEGKVPDRLVCGERIRELDSLPRPAYERFARLPYHVTTELLRGRRVFSLSSSRGCPFACSFCSAKNIWARRYTWFSAERIVDDMKYLQRTHDVDGVYFREDNFTVNKKRITELCELMLREKLDLEWATESRVDTVDRELLGLMHRAGCRGLYLGLEAATQARLDDYAKGITLEQIERFLGWTLELDLRVYASFLIDTPQETLEDRRALWRFAERWKHVRCSANHFTGLPGSELYDQVIRDRAYTLIDDVGLAHLPHKPFPTTTPRLWLRKKLGRRR